MSGTSQRKAHPSESYNPKQVLTRLYLLEVIAELRPELHPEQVAWMATHVIDFIGVQPVPTLNSLISAEGSEYWLP